jgi:hypothetical protein
VLQVLKEDRVESDQQVLEVLKVQEVHKVE